MPTSLAELSESVRSALGLTPRDALALVSRVVPTFQILTLEEAGVEAGGANAALGRLSRGAVAGQFSYGQLLNPANSGTVIRLFQAVFVQLATSACHFSRDDTAMPFLHTDTAWADQRRTGAPVGQNRSEDDAAILGTELYSGSVEAGVRWQIDFPKPIILGPGQGVNLRSDLFNETINASFFWTEEAA